MQIMFNHLNKLDEELLNIERDFPDLFTVSLFREDTGLQRFDIDTNAYINARERSAEIKEEIKEQIEDLKEDFPDHLDLIKEFLLSLEEKRSIDTIDPMQLPEKERAHFYMSKIDAYEEQIARIEKSCPNIDEKLITTDGFPRADIDVLRITQMKFKREKIRIEIEKLYKNIEPLILSGVVFNQD
ncbi:hypothetical protein PCE1_000458 [Barthelona sp. PCE]